MLPHVPKLLNGALSVMKQLRHTVVSRAPIESVQIFTPYMIKRYSDYQTHKDFIRIQDYETSSQNGEIAFFPIPFAPISKSVGSPISTLAKIPT